MNNQLISEKIGWICPICNNVYAPSIIMCEKCSPKTIEVSTINIYFHSTSTK